MKNNTHRDEKTSGPLLVNLVRRRTAREATIVDAIAAGTLKMIDITALRLSNMNTVARRFARKLNKQLSVTEKGNQRNERYGRHHKENKTVSKDQAHESAATIPREEKLICRKTQDKEVETHRIDKCGRKDSVVCLGDDASSRGHPCCTD